MHPLLSLFSEMVNGQEAYSPPILLDRKFVEKLVSVRKSQSQFRSKLLKIDGSCCVTGYKVHEVLEAARITSVAESGTNELSNGLLLRSDIYALFDKKLLSISPEYLIQLSPEIMHTEYRTPVSYTHLTLPTTPYV